MKKPTFITKFQPQSLDTYLVYPFTMLLYFATTTSNQPHLLLRPVVTPNSLPSFCRRSPISYIIKIIRIRSYDPPYIIQFSRESPFAHSSCICLEDTIDMSNKSWGNPQTSTDHPSWTVTWCHIRVGPYNNQTDSISKSFNPKLGCSYSQKQLRRKLITCLHLDSPRS